LLLAGEVLVGLLQQRFFCGRYAPSAENLRLRLGDLVDVEELQGLYRLKGQRVFSEEYLKEAWL
jgi:hypothetical protein